jgi:hypothetical protein
MLSREVSWHLSEELLALEKRLADGGERFEAICQTYPWCGFLMDAPCNGRIAATALVATTRDAVHFKNGRQSPAWLSLVLREHSTGGKTRLHGSSAPRTASREESHRIKTFDSFALVKCHYSRETLRLPKQHASPEVCA